MTAPVGADPDSEFIDDVAGIGFRRVVVGPLATNCWIVFSTSNGAAVLVDPGDEPTRLIDATHGLDVRAIVLTHSHWDHVLALPHVADHLGAPVLMHPDDTDVWPHECDHLATHGHFDAGTATDELLAAGCSLRPPADAPAWDGRTHPIIDGEDLPVGDRVLRVIATPGHTPGGISLRVGTHVFTGDTLFPGGPGLTGWPLSDFPTIINSIRRRLLSLPGNTAVHPGHGPSTTIGAEAPDLASWIERGW